MSHGSSPSPTTFAALRDLAREHPVEVTVRGGCMAPLLADGERVAVAPARCYWPGDVVVFQAADGRLLVHRLLGWRPWEGAFACVTRGDGCPCHDAPVPPSRLLGRVIAPERARAAVSDRLRAVLSFLRIAVRRTP
ncbi:MAG TPA: S24/S26 family peptidase [Thermoanaerobaculia bacterium]|nr:S24/S26 family peptidase [Thermoanaerobaculia bacterium]